MASDIDQAALFAYLRKRFGATRLQEFKLLGEGVYGHAHLAVFDTRTGRRRLVVKTMHRGGFGHDHFSDIAGNLLYANLVYNKLPNHVKAFDVIGINPDGSIASAGEAREFYILLEEARGRLYNQDLDEILQGRKAAWTDFERARLLADYLAGIHAVKKNNPVLYTRRARDLVGHGEYIMGVLDGYPSAGLKENFAAPKDFEKIAKLGVEWWMRLKAYPHRLSQVHGDFHPFNIFFDSDKLVTIDRSRGEWGEPADDTTSLSINYIFWALLQRGEFSGDFEKLFQDFFKYYLAKTKDKEILEVSQPFWAFRAVVLACPVFYSDEFFRKKTGELTAKQFRKTMFRFATRVMETEKVDLKKINDLL
jgi:tRNA A-37 threonylcarbamoyl transferase component Bud32